MTTHFHRAYPPQTVPSYPALWLLFHGNKLILQTEDSRNRTEAEKQATKETLSIPLGDATLLAEIEHEEILYLGLLGDIPCVTTNLKDETRLPANWRAVGLRELYHHLPEIEFELAGYAHQITNWQHSNRYCPVCTTPLLPIAGHWGHKCPNNHYTGYPPVIPAMIVLVHDNDRVLLAHKPGWGKRYGLFAGFVEPSESMEECVRRELREEAGIEVTDIHYFTSQAWPFPDQLMIGFTARYAGGEPEPQDGELDDIAWFNLEKLPGELPPPFSLAYALINDWLTKQTAQAALKEKE
jgi:NAD+ diphosphatase